MRQLFIERVIGTGFDWGLATETFAREWTKSALSSSRRGARTPGGLPASPVQFDLWPGEVLEHAPAPWTPQPPDRHWTTAPRPMSIPARRLSRRELVAANARLQLVEAGEPADLLLHGEPTPHPTGRQQRGVYTRNPELPLTRAECLAGPRPCPYVSCRHHLYLDVSENGWLKLNFPHLEVWEMAETCALDVADRDGVTLEQLGALFNISLEGARQVEIDVLGELRAKLGEEELVALLKGGGGE